MHIMCMIDCKIKASKWSVWLEKVETAEMIERLLYVQISSRLPLWHDLEVHHFPPREQTER